MKIQEIQCCVVERLNLRGGSAVGPPVFATSVNSVQDIVCDRLGGIGLGILVEMHEERHFDHEAWIFDARKFLYNY